MPVSADPRFIPTEVRAPVGGDVVEIDWRDGHTSKIPNDRLRGYCPCAGCQGHEGPLTFIESGSREIADVSQVGNYALSFRFGDGHETGIYTFPYLRRLCTCETCLPAFDPEKR
jgi:DUF971 family protein